MTAEEPPLDELLEAWQRAQRARDELPNGSFERAVAEEDVKFAHSAYRRRLRELEHGEPNLADLLANWLQAERMRDQVPEGSPLRPAVERQIEAAHDEYERRLAEIDGRALRD